MAGEDLPAGRFKAFISYRHVPADARWANWLHEALERYRLPKKVASARGLPRRLGRIAQDEKELATSPDLGEAIRNALDRAEWLIVVCSPRARESEWISAEIDHFRQGGRGGRVLSLLIEGEPEEAFPAPLLAIEPLAADVRGREGESRRTTRRLALLRLVATLTGCDFDELRRRDDERRRRRFLWSAAVLAILFVILGGAIVYATQQARAAQRSEAEAHVEEALQRGAGGEAAAWLARLPPTFANGGRWARAIHAGMAWTLVQRTDRTTTGAVAWSPGGDRFAWGDDEERLHVWDMATGQHRVFGTVDPEYDHPIQRIAWSPDPNVLAAIEWSGNVTVWDLRREQPIAVFDDLNRLGYDPGAHFALAWSRDGSQIAGAAGSGARIWDLRSRTAVAEYALAADSQMTWSRDLTLLAISDAAQATIHDGPSTRRINDAKLPTVSVAAWSPDGKRIAIGTLADELRFASWTPPRAAISDEGIHVSRRLGVREVDFEQGDDPEAAMSVLGRLRRLEWAPSGERVAYLNGGTAGWREGDSALQLPHDNATTIVWSPDGERLAVGLEAGDIYIWEVANTADVPEAIFRVGDGAGIVSLAWSPDGRALASVTEVGPVQIWDTVTTIARTIQPGTTYIDDGKTRARSLSGLTWPKAADAVVAWTGNNEVAVVQPSRKMEVAAARGSDECAFSTSPDGSAVAYVSRAGMLTVLDLASRTRRTLAPPLPEDIEVVAWSPDGTTIAVAASDAVRFWRAAGGAGPKAIAGDSISAFAWSADSRSVAIGQWDGSVVLHRPLTRERQPLRAATGKNYDAVRNIDWAPRQELLLRMNEGAELWDAEGTRMAKLDDPWRVAWRPGGEEFAVADTREIHFLRTRDAQPSRPSLRLDFHELYTFNIAALAWSDDGRYLASNGEHATLRIWDMESRLGIALPTMGTSVSSAAWSHDGTRIASSGGDGTVRLWRVPWDAAAVEELAQRVPNVAVDDEGNVRVTEFKGLPWRRRR